jgi:two-component system sensor histidine kinase CreC
VTARSRIFVGVLLVYLIGVGVLMYRLLADIDPRYRESAEESLVETAHLLAAAVERQAVMAAAARATAATAEPSAAIPAQPEPAASAARAAPAASAAEAPPAASAAANAPPASASDIAPAASAPAVVVSGEPGAPPTGSKPAPALDPRWLEPLFRDLYARRFHADIFGVIKESIELRATVVDADGIVLFDSLGRHEGKDFSQWRDVKLALAGQYGARTSPDIEHDVNTSVMVVAVPLRHHGRIVGAVEVAKPVRSFGQFIEAARRKTMMVGVTSVGAVLVLMVIVSLWLVRPLGLVTEMMRYARRQRHFSLRRFGRHAIDTLRAAFGEMREAFGGRQYVADYVQTLTHELKSPLSAIRGAAELLREAGMPEADRQRFIANIGRETERIQELVDRMMELTALEQQQRLAHVQRLPLRPLLRELAASAEAAGAARGLRVQLRGGPHLEVDGDPLLLRRAVGNLLDNALDFSPQGGTIELALDRHGPMALVTVLDQGPGIPAFADDKVFEKFYSLARPHNHRRSTGLGLAFVRQIAALHGGDASLRNGDGGGALATLALPLSDLRSGL